MSLRFRASFLYALFFFSGACGLGYQLVWARMFGVGLGHEMAGVLAVVAAFFGGLALGAWCFDRPISSSRHPGRWYGVLELVIGGWGLLSFALIPLFSRLALPWIGLEPSPLRHWSIAFGVPFFVLLPATTAMGATFTAMERFVAPLAPEGRCVGKLYATNTLGAVAGTLLSTFTLVPTLGFRTSLVILAGLSLLCGLIALQIPLPVPVTRALLQEQPPLPVWRLHLTVLVTGLLGIGYETLGVRVLSQVLENTIYSFTLVLVVYLTGTALGAAWYQRFARKWQFHPLLSFLLCGISIGCLSGQFLLWVAPLLYPRIHRILGDTFSGGLGTELIIATLVFLLPTFFMGATFSHLVQAARREGGGVGRAIALNTFGSALAPLLFGVLLLPALGSKWALVTVAAGYLLLIHALRGRQWLVPGIPLILIFLLPADFRLVQLPPGARLLENREGIMDSVAVIEHLDGNRSLQVNNRFTMGGTGAANAERRHAHLPLLLHPHPRRALFLGLGTGITFGAAGAHSELAADGVELVPEVIEVSRYFSPANALPDAEGRLNIYAADARRFVRATPERYDVIVADLFHPARDGAGSLYTREHFQAIRDRLAPGGLVCQWLPLFQLDEPMLKVIVRTFLEVFPQTRGYLLRLNLDTPVLGLVATLDPVRYPADWFDQRVRDPKLMEQLKPLTLTDGFQLFGSLVASPSALRDFSKGAPLNTDDQPVVIFGAPRFTFQHGTTPYGRLLSLMKLRGGDAHELMQPGAEPFVRELSQFMDARDVYLQGLLAESEGKRREAVEAFVESARLSPNFSTGYAHCLTLAMQEAKSNPRAARALLERLVQAQPQRPVAQQLLDRLGPPTVGPRREH